MTRLSAAFGRVFDALAVAAALVLFAMVAIVTADVAARNVIGAGIAWANEISEYALYVMTLLTAPWLLRRGQHVRLDIVLTFVPSRMSHDAIREINARAHVMNELVDEAVARVLGAIGRRGWSERTDVFFTTDHGELQGDFGLVYKGPFHTDSLMRLPFVWAPAPEAGVTPAVLDDPVGQLDLVPTFCAIAGVDAPDGIDGRPLPLTPGSGNERVICEWDSILPGYGMHMRSMYRDGWLVTAYEPSTVGTPNGFEEFLRLRGAARSSRLEQVGRELRQMMPWLESDKKVVPRDER